MMELSKIIWASDGSKESEEALKYAALIAKKFNSHILGVYVSLKRLKNLQINFRHLSNELFYNLVQKAEQNRKANFNSIAKMLATQGIKFNGKILKGEKSEKILEVADKEKADLIVVGTRSHGLLERFFLGNTTLDVLRNSKIPVLAHKNQKGEKETNIKNILVPIDIFNDTNSSLIYSLELARKLNARIIILYIVTLDVYDYRLPEDIVNDIVFYANNGLEKSVEKIKLNLSMGQRKPRVIINIEKINGPNYGITISEYAKKNEIDLIIIQRHNRGSLERFFIGSVTEFLIEEAQCSVLALPP